MGEPVVRAATPEDAREIAEARWFGERAALTEAFPGGFPQRWLEPPVGDLAIYWEDLLATKRKRMTTLVAVVDEQVVVAGEAGPSADLEEQVAQLHYLYARPAAWGTGVARAVHEELIERICSDGFRAATLWVIEPNARARRFYEREGWTKVPERRTTATGLPLIRYDRTL